MRQAAAFVVLAAVDVGAWPNPVKWSLPEDTAAAVRGMPSSLAEYSNLGQRMRAALQMGSLSPSPAKQKQSEWWCSDRANHLMATELTCILVHADLLVQHAAKLKAT